MKKILGIVGAFVFALTMLFNTTNFEIKGNQDVSLSSLLSLNTANAESIDYNDWGFGRSSWSGRCYHDAYVDECNTWNDYDPYYSFR
ncbi:hypothetical protein [uncultured Algibacter sp.]|uniref:hypothetical protein n=1 Tax=uncultured Algibacter sp. TaxID=298659 RepID=UPI002614E520|nr:hypothetical protein [uncultured Algibacter sp.]